MEAHEHELAGNDFGLTPNDWAIVAAFAIIATCLLAWGFMEPAPATLPGDWADQRCSGHGGLEALPDGKPNPLMGADGQLTAVCADGCRHILDRSHNEKMGRERWQR